MNQSLTVVLPLHNAEATLRRSVDRVLEVAGELTPRVDVLVIDDGSTDDTYDVARELAARFPQVRAVRQGRRLGLGPTIRNARRRVASDVVMVHDGVSRVDAEQLRALWDRRIDPAGPTDVTAADLLRPKQNQAAMAAAHSRLMSFQLFNSEADSAAAAGREAAHGLGQPAAKAAGPRRRANPAAAGAVPPLPAPNFLGAVGDFAWGE
ncbi:MAG: glycosyltransferase [Planctomycetota bacterium]